MKRNRKRNMNHLNQNYKYKRKPYLQFKQIVILTHPRMTLKIIKNTLKNPSQIQRKIVRHNYQKYLSKLNKLELIEEDKVAKKTGVY